MSTTVDGPPGPRSPSSWQSLRYYADFMRYMEACTARYGSVFTIKLRPFDAFVIASDPPDVQAILTDTDRFVGGEAARLLLPLVGPSSVIITSGAAHMRQRRLLLPPFHGDLVARWRERITMIADERLAQLPTDEPIALRPVMERITMDTICRLVFGVEEDAELVRLREHLLRSFDPRLAPLLFVPTLFRRTGRLNPGRVAIERRAAMHRMLDEQIASRRADPRLPTRDDVLSTFVCTRDDDGQLLPDAELRDQLLTLLIAGYETTATSLACAVERLSRTPTALARLEDELAGERTDGAYLDAVVKETLRLRSPVVDAVRTTTQDVELGGHRVPADTLVGAMFVLTHRRPDLWPEPLAFRPERFLAGRLLPYSFTPFGGGIRRCIGSALSDLETKLVLRTLLKRFALAPAPGGDEPMRLNGITLRPAHGGRVILRARRRPTAPDAHRRSGRLRIRPQV